jgi:hypothetical protein
VTAAAEREAAESVALARIAAALPLAVAFAWLALVYAWQAWLVTTPVIFTDELLYAELSRSLAETGETLVRGEPHAFESLSIVPRAAAWLVADGESAYLLAKLIGVLAMTGAALPAYMLARLVASPRASLFAAVATAAIPALSYSALLLEEPIAYPLATLAFALGVRALARREPVVVLATVALAALAPFVRGQLVLVPIVLSAAALGVAWWSEPVRRRRRRMRPLDTLALLAAGTAGVAGASVTLADRSPEWDVAISRPGAMIDNAVWAAGAFTIGVGILPVIVALAGVARPAGAPRTAERSAFTAILVAAVPAFLVYTAGKGAWLDTFLEPRVLERNVVYLAPLVFTGVALWLDRPRLRPVAVVAAGVAVLAVLQATPVQLGYPYFEAPGFALAALANREIALGQGQIGTLLLVAAAICVALILAARRIIALPVIAAVVVVAWNLGGETYAALGFRDFAERLEREAPQPPDWVDRATGGREAVYLGEQVADSTPIHLLEFWNSSLGRVAMLDRTTVPPGPTEWPTVDAATGRVLPDPGAKYAVVDSRIAVVGKQLQTVGPFSLYSIARPLRLRETISGVDSDGWMGASSAYTRYWAPTRGYVDVTVGRAGWTGRDVPSPVVIRVGPMTLDAAGSPVLVSVSAERRGVLHSKRRRTYRLPSPPVPFRVEITVARTFVPAELDPTTFDQRALGAQVSFRVVPRG